MNKFFKGIYTILILLLCFSVLLFVSCTPNDNYSELIALTEEKTESFEYKKEGNVVSILKYIGKTENVRIPSKIEGKRVVEIGSNAFSGTMVGTVVLPSTVETICEEAFFNCKNLSNIIIPKSVKTIQKNAFGNNNFLYIYCEARIEPEGWDDEWSYTPPMALMNSKPMIDGYGTAYNLYRGEVTLMRASGTAKEVNIQSQIGGYDVTSINSSAFFNCKNLENVIIPSSVTYISSIAFDLCPNLKEIIIPATVRTIEDDAFCRCSNLIIYCEETNKPSGWSDKWNIGERYSMDEYAIGACPVYWYSESQPTIEGDWWHYVYGEPVVWE